MLVKTAQAFQCSVNAEGGSLQLASTHLCIVVQRNGRHPELRNIQMIQNVE